MKSKRNTWIIGLLLVCGTVYAQVELPARRGIIPSRRPGLSENGTTAVRHRVAGDGAIGVPALNLTWGIVTFPGQTDSGAAGVNKAGHMVGGYGPLLEENYTNHGFLLKGSKFTTVDYPGAGWTQPLAINDANVIVGAYGADANSPAHGFELKGKTYTSVDYPGASYTRPSGINKSGEVVGQAYDTADHGFLLSKGVFSPINYPGAAYTVAWSINNSGEIVGYYGLTYSDSHGFLYSNGTYTTFDYPGYSQNYVGDINDSGLIVGGYGDDTTVNGVEYLWEHCYVYQGGQFTSCDAPFGPPAVTEPWHLNNYGVITGTYVDNSATTYGFEATVSP